MPYVNIDGVTLYYEEHGSGPAVILTPGESPSTPVAPATANAVANAIGVRIRSLPVTSEKVFPAL